VWDKLQFVDESVFDSQQFDLEDQCRVRRDDRWVASDPCISSALIQPAQRTGCTVTEIRGNGELPLLRDTHVQQTLIPAFDDLSSADCRLRVSKELK
jgi:hypothetical protein